MQVAAFDNYASYYDEHFTFSPIGKIQRRQVIDHLRPFLSKQKSVLEINCGTGQDAIEMIAHVKTMLATDASAEMISRSNSKLGKETKGLTFLHKNIQELKDELKSADLVFSNFAGLNCLSPQELKNFANACSDLLPANADLFLVFLGQKCLWERMYFLVKLKRGKAFRRIQKGPVATMVEGSSFNTWYYSPAEITEIFNPAFRQTALGPVGLFVPPSYLNSFFKGKRGLLSFLNFLDRFFCKFKWLANYGDHFYLHLKKTN
jgi:SAM-dependent methyltransferase